MTLFEYVEQKNKARNDKLARYLTAYHKSFMANVDTLMPAPGKNMDEAEWNKVFDRWFDQ